MRRAQLWFVRAFAGLLALGAAGVSFGQKGKPSDNTPLTSTLHDTGAFSDATNYRLQSDGLGPYVHGVSSVVAQFQDIGDWEMDTAASATRIVLVDLRDPVPNSGANPPFSYANMHARFISKCSFLGIKISAMTGLGSTALCPMVVRWDSGGYVWRLNMNSLEYPEVNFALFTCSGVVDPANPSTSACNEWSVTPSTTQPDGQTKNRAQLLRFTLKGKTVTEDFGDFYLTFSFRITRP